jgi:hypothetical protein
MKKNIRRASYTEQRGYTALPKEEKTLCNENLDRLRIRRIGRMTARKAMSRENGLVADGRRQAGFKDGGFGACLLWCAEV